MSFRYITIKTPAGEYVTGSEFIGDDQVDPRYRIDGPIDFDPVKDGVFCYRLNEDGSVTDESEEE